MANAMAPAQSVIDFQRRLQQRRLIKTLDDLACAAVDAGRIVATTEMARGDAAADLQDMAMAGGLVAKHGDDMVTGCIGAGLYLGEKEAEERLEKTHLHEKALSSDTDRMRPKLRTVTAADLYATQFSPIAFVIPGYIAEGLTVLAGRPKVGKSWLALGWERRLSPCGGTATRSLHGR